MLTKTCEVKRFCLNGIKGSLDLATVKAYMVTILPNTDLQIEWLVMIVYGCWCQHFKSLNPETVAILF